MDPLGLIQKPSGLILAGTGHRPTKLGGYETPNPIYDAVLSLIDKELIRLRPDVVISGMALGFDQWLASICIKNDIPFVAAIPCDGHDDIWPDYSREWYHQLLSKAAYSYIVSPGPYQSYKMHKRNVWMLRHSNKLLAAWDGSKGGTYSCVSAAKKMGMEIIYLNIPAINYLEDSSAVEAFKFQSNYSQDAALSYEAQKQALMSQQNMVPAQKLLKFPELEKKQESQKVEQSPYARFVDLND